MDPTQNNGPQTTPELNQNPNNPTLVDNVSYTQAPHQTVPLDTRQDELNQAYQAQPQMTTQFPTQSPAETPPSTPIETQTPYQSPIVSSPPPLQPPTTNPLDDEHEGAGIPFIVKILIGAVIMLVIAGLALFIMSRISSKPSTTKVTLTYWGLWEDPNTMNVVLSDFTRAHPNITVNYTREDPKQYTERLLTRTTNGNGPDVFRYHNSWVPELLPILTPLSKDVITPQDFTSNYYPVVTTDLVKNGAIYGIPLEIDTLSLFVNPSLFSKAGISVPTTWNEFVTAAKTLTVTDTTGKIKTAGAGLGTFNNVTHAPDVMSMLFAQSNVDPKNFTKSSGDASDALTFYTSFAQGQNAVWNASLDPTWMSFAKGNLAMYFGYSWDIFQIQTLNPTLQFAIYPVPHLPNRNQTIASYWVEGISNKSKHQKEAQMLLAYLAQKDTEQKLYTEETKTRSFGEPYARMDIADTVKTNPLVYPFLLNAKDAVSSFFVDSTYDTGINAPLNTYLSNAVNAVLGNTSPQSAVTTLSQGVTQIFTRYGITK